MRIISGEKKSQKLVGITRKTIRPTTDRDKEKIFSTIFECKDLKVLDLFAGSGSLGFEALSRGAKFVDFIDASGYSISIIIKNAKKLEFENYKVSKKKVSRFLKNNEKEYDLIFLDPPYNKKLINNTLESIFTSELTQNATIVVEHSKKERIDDKWKDFVFYESKAGRIYLSILRRENNENL